MDRRETEGKGSAPDPLDLDTDNVNQNEDVDQRERTEGMEVTHSELFEEQDQGQSFVQRELKDEDDKASAVGSRKESAESKKSRAHRKSRSETDPLLMTIPELTKFLQAKATKRKTRVTQRQRAALLGFLPPGMPTPAKVLGKPVPATESAVEPKDSGVKAPSVSKSVVQKALPKLRRKSLLEHMERQMECHGQKAVLFRLVTIGSHEENADDLLESQEKLMKELNVAPELEFLTGLLIVYPKHFLHVLEGSEMALSQYISDAAYEFEKKPTLVNLEEEDKVQHVRMIILGTFQVDQRFMKKWQGVATPYPTHSNLMDISGYQKRLLEFMKRTWILLIVSRNFISLLPLIKDAEEEAKAKVSIPRQTVDEPSKAVNPVAKLTESDFGLLSITTFAPVADNINDSVNELMEESMGLLPSLPILQYFLKDKERCPKLLTPQQHIDKYWGLSNEPSWRDIVWPIPGRLYPYD